MKTAAGILAFIWAFVLFQPAFAHFGGNPAYETCEKPVVKKSACSKSKTAVYSKKKAGSTGCAKGKCNKPSTPPDNGGCRSNGCNPSVGCSSGNFFIHHYSQFSLASFTVQHQKPVITNDNRIIKIMSECWHPPEA
ncbi:MAG: hypothetical protein JNK27_12905 [Chitinophagaceae bacterium]|nr:hypothetical protein [Chitinophagaceae bacterium]